MCHIKAICVTTGRMEAPFGPIARQRKFQKGPYSESRDRRALFLQMSAEIGPSFRQCGGGSPPSSASSWGARSALKGWSWGGGAPPCFGRREAPQSSAWRREEPPSSVWKSYQHQIKIILKSIELHTKLFNILSTSYQRPIEIL